jgi:hypothetical protein
MTMSMGRSVMVLLATVGGAAFGQPGEAGKGGAGGGPGRGDSSPWKVTFTTQGEYTTAADFKADGGGSVSVARANAGLAVSGRLGETGLATVSLGWQRSWYDFDSPSVFGASAPWDEINEIDLSFVYRARINEKWSWFGGGGVNSAGEDGADFGDTLTGGGVLGVGYAFSEKFRLTGGLLVRSQLEEEVSFVPIIGVDWKIAEKWRLSTDYRRSIFPRPSVSLIHSVSDSLDVALSVGYETRVFRLDEDGTNPDGVARERRVPVEVIADWKISPNVSLNAMAGVSTWGRYRLDDSTGTRITQSEVEPAGIFGLSVKLEF